jgi:proteic killer suppression protein
LPAASLGCIESILLLLESAASPKALEIPAYRLHRLRGNLKSFWSVSVSGNWRIIFRFEDGDAHDVDFIDYH